MKRIIPLLLCVLVVFTMLPVQAKADDVTINVYNWGQYISDGTNGTFVVVDNPKMQQLALVMPTVNITTACTGHDIQTSHGCKRIVTDTAGTATLINGHWHIKTQATVHYEA